MSGTLAMRGASYASDDLQFITALEANDVLDRAAEVTRLLNGLIRHYARHET